VDESLSSRDRFKFSGGSSCVERESAAPEDLIIDPEEEDDEAADC